MGIAGEARPLRRADSVPLWSQLESELRRRINDGDFSERFPTDLEITKLYGVSRHTARHAVDRLASEHLLTRERGRGTVVNRLKFEQSLETLYSIFQLVEAEGAEQKSTVLALEVVVDADVAARLGLPPDADLTFLDRVRFADGEPLARDRVWMDATTTSDLLSCDFSHTALYHELERTGGPRPTNGMPSPKEIADETVAADVQNCIIHRCSAAIEPDGDCPGGWRLFPGDASTLR